MFYDEDIMEMMRQAAFDSVIECPECGNRLEPDAEKCGECGCTKTLRGLGLI